MGDHIRKKGGWFGAVWARENSKGKGPHVHIFAHIPLEFSKTVKRLQQRWLRKAAGVRKLTHGTMRGNWVEGLGPGDACDRSNWMQQRARENSERVIRYLLEGASAKAGAIWGLKQTGSEGVVIGKRAGTTENIGRSKVRTYGLARHVIH